MLAVKHVNREGRINRSRYLHTLQPCLLALWPW